MFVFVQQLSFLWRVVYVVYQIPKVMHKEILVSKTVEIHEKKFSCEIVTLSLFAHLLPLYLNFRHQYISSENVQQCTGVSKGKCKHKVLYKLIGQFVKHCIELISGIYIYIYIYIYIIPYHLIGSKALVIYDMVLQDEEIFFFLLRLHLPPGFNVWPGFEQLQLVPCEH